MRSCDHKVHNFPCQQDTIFIVFDYIQHIQHIYCESLVSPGILAARDLHFYIYYLFVFEDGV